MSVHPVTLTTLDGAVLEVDCDPGLTVLEAAANAGRILPAQCRSGSCGSCAAHAAGDYHLGSFDADALPTGPPPEPDLDAVLLCRTYPDGPMRVRLRCDSSRILTESPARREATLTALDVLAPDVVRLVLDLDPTEDGGTGVEFDPGQFVELEVPGSSLRRAYSLANTANWDGQAELLVRLLPGGVFSSYLAGPARIGDRLVVHGPQGAFGLVETGLRPRWFVAGGTGLAPLLSMLRQMAEFGEPHPARLFLGVNVVESLFATDLLADLATQLPTFIHRSCIRDGADETRPPGTSPGTPVDALAADLADWQAAGGAEPELYLCGPPGMVTAATATALASGLAPHRILSERFT